MAQWLRIFAVPSQPNADGETDSYAWFGWMSVCRTISESVWSGYFPWNHGDVIRCRYVRFPSGTTTTTFASETPELPIADHPVGKEAEPKDLVEGLEEPRIEWDLVVEGRGLLVEVSVPPAPCLARPSRALVFGPVLLHVLPLHQVGASPAGSRRHHEGVDAGRVRAAALHRRALQGVVEPYPTQVQRAKRSPRVRCPRRL